MNYRYEEILSWIIPGFYFLLLAAIEMICFFGNIIPPTESSGSPCLLSYNSVGVIMVLLIPLISLIVGWIINGAGGYLMRIKALGDPIIFGAYKKIYEIKENPKSKNKEAESLLKEAVRLFDNAKYRLHLGDIDRFYYRYVFSRNMWVTELFSLILWAILAIRKAILLITPPTNNSYKSLFQRLYEKTDFSSPDMICFYCLIVLILFSWKIVGRDLDTHARYVYAYNKLELHKCS